MNMRFLGNVFEKLSAGDTPNHLTIAMGKLIHHAREEKGFSQRELATKIYRRLTSLSDMENGKMEPHASTLTFLSYHLNIPISYFSPNRCKPEIELGDLSDPVKEILLHAKQLDKNNQVRIIAQLRALTNLDLDSRKK
jgi:transcriptional regulator with XRE-family HTH domain